jgi:hypothetical protein
MTANKKMLKLSTILTSVARSSFHIEMRKSSRGAVAVISGVMSIGEYTDSVIELLSHSGRIAIIGESLGVSVLEGRIVEVYGIITEVKLGYGKA